MNSVETKRSFINSRFFYMLTIKKNNLFWEYFFMLGIIALTGFEFFFRDSYLIFLFLGPLSLFIFYRRKLKFTKKIAWFLLVLLTLSFLQSITYQIPYSVVFTTVIRFFIYYLIASILIKEFVKVYINILSVISVLSIVLYALINISSSVYNFLLSISNGIVPLSFNSESGIITANPNNTLIFFTIPHELKFRNSGPFWEPGMFGVFLSIAFAFTIFKYGIKNKKSIIFLIAAITTLSTTTYIAVFLIIGIHLYLKKVNTYTMIGFVLLSVIIVQIYNLPFINNKINSDFNNRDKAYSRFGAMVVHYNQIIDSPWIGYGTNIDKDQEERLGIKEVTPNGLTNVVRSFGIPFSLLYYYLLFNAAIILSGIIIPNNRKYALLLFFVFLIVAFSQDVTTRHFYFVLIVLMLTYNPSKKLKRGFIIKE